MKMKEKINERKKEDEIYCPECGQPVKRKAVLCMNCGVQINDLRIPSSQNNLLKELKDKNSINIIYSEIKEKVKDQYDSINLLVTKSSIVLPFTGALIAGLLNATAFSSLNITIRSISLSLLILSMVLILISIFIWNYPRDPDPDNLIKRYQNEPELNTKAQLIRNFSECYYRLEKFLRVKKYLLNISFLLITATVIIVVLGILLNK